MTDDFTLEEFDKKLEEAEEPPKKERRSFVAIRDQIVNSDVAAKLVSGVPITSLAVELGVNPATIRKWMQKMEMKDLIAIEQRRLIRHMSKRDLSKEKYLGLTTALAVLIDKERGLRDGLENENNRVLNQTTIEQINILISRRGSEAKGEEVSRDIPQLDAESIPELPEEPEKG